MNSDLYIDVVTNDGRQYRVLCDPSEIIVGRGGRRNLSLDDPRVSRAHLKIAFEPGGIVAVTDLVSANGTTLEGRRLPPSQRVLWPIGQTIQVGDTRLTLQAAPPLRLPPADPEPDVALPDLDLEESRIQSGALFDPGLLAELDQNTDAPMQQDLIFASVEEMVEAAQQAQDLRDVLEGRTGDFNPIIVTSIYIVALALCEGLTSLLSPPTGLVVYALLWVVLALYVAWQWDRPVQRNLIVLGTVPLIRLVSLSLPLHPIPEITWFAVIGIPLAAAGYLMQKALGLSWSDVGVTLRQWFLQLVIGASGLATGYLIFRLVQPDALVQSTRPLDLVVASLILLLSTGLVEEYLFHGVMQTSLYRATGYYSLVVVAALYALLQVGNESGILVVLMFVLALVYGWLAQRTGSIAGIAVAHGLTNVMVFVLLPNL